VAFAATNSAGDTLLKTSHKLGLAALAGAGIGVAAVTTIQALEPKIPPAYVIAEVERDPSRTADPAALRRYADEAPKSVIPFDGRYVVRGGTVETLEGDAPKGYIVMIAFDSVAKAHDWYYSPAYQAIKPIRANSTRSRILIVEGVAP
jgi:uncharacterized protein (DUF1330 family)